MFIDTPTGAEVTDKAIQGVLSRVDALAGKLGIAAQHLWEIYILQARVEALRDLLLAGVYIAISIVLIRIAIPKLLQAWNKEREYDRHPAYIALSCVAGLVAAIFLCLSISYSYQAIGEWFNPQYWAFQHLTLDLKNLF